MPFWIRAGRIGVLALLASIAVGSGLTLAAPVEGAAKSPAVLPSDPDTLYSLAQAAEQKGDWDKALEYYLRTFVAGRQLPEIRDKIKDCVRHASQTRRYRDAGFQQFVLNLPPSDALNLYVEVVTKLRSNYSDRDRATPERLFELGLEEFDRALADTGFRARHLGEVDTSEIEKFRRLLRSEWANKLPRSPREARQAVFAVTEAVQKQLGARNPSAVVFEFLCGACTGLDEYTVYLAPGSAQSEFASPILELAAYGVLIAFQGEGVVIESIVPDSWAAVHTPLRPGDRILRANGRLLQPGPAGTLAEALRVPIEGGHELEVAPGMGTISGMPVRLPTPVPTVISADILKDGIGYIRLGGFRSTTPAELDDALVRLRDRGLRALVLDLRGNTGGLFSVGIQVAQRFIPSGIIATTQGQAAEFANRVFSSDSGMAALDLPVVLLIDTKTMSSAEVVAGALKDHSRATLIGMPTFGKGAIQYPFPLRRAEDGADAGGLRTRSGVLIVTIAKAFSPRGAAIHRVGVMPDVIEPDPQRQLELALARALELVGAR